MREKHPLERQIEQSVCFNRKLCEQCQHRVVIGGSEPQFCFLYAMTAHGEYVDLKTMGSCGYLLEMLYSESSGGI